MEHTQHAMVKKRGRQNVQKGLYTTTKGCWKLNLICILWFCLKKFIVLFSSYHLVIWKMSGVWQIGTSSANTCLEPTRSRDWLRSWDWSLTNGWRDMKLYRCYYIIHVAHHFVWQGIKNNKVAVTCRFTNLYTNLETRL